MVVKIRPYRYPTIQKCEMEMLIQQILEEDIIKDNYNPFASPIVMVKKKDGTWRHFVDYKQLNY